MARPATHSRVDVSVIIVNYNVREYLANALRSLSLALKGIRSEIIVVDNDSADGSVEMIRKRFPRVVCIPSKVNLGFARANNLALKRAKGEFLFLLNPDTLVQEDTVRVMVKYFRDHPKAGLAGCRILNPDGSFQLAARRSFPTPWVAFSRISGLSRMFPSSRLFGRYNLTYLPTDQSYPVEAVSGSCMFMRRETYEQVGGLDEEFFMYGEDLDWCFRVRESGWQVHYVHGTSIIHYKGESTRRSSVDEISVFYEAMRIFVRKHFGASGGVLFILRSGIRVATIGAWVTAHARRAWPAVIDTVLLLGAFFVAEFIRKGEILSYPDYAYPTVFIVPPLVLIGTFLAMGVYSHRSMSVSRSSTGVVVAFIVLSAVTAFFKEYAFSRAIVLTAGALCLFLLSGWRVGFRMLTRSTPLGRSTAFGRRAVVVGVDQQAHMVARKLRSNPGGGYEVVGYVETESSAGSVEGNDGRILGTVGTIRKVIREFKVSDVIVAPKAMSNIRLLEMISACSNLPVSFHLVAGSMEFLISRASVESLEDVPLVEISYNLQKPMGRLAKRCMDIVVSAAGLITVYPFVYLFRRRSLLHGVFLRFLPKVLSGGMSLVGPPAGAADSMSKELFLGKPGVTGLVQLQQGRGLTEDEQQQLVIRYARSQSFLLDIEILLKFAVEHARG